MGGTGFDTANGVAVDLFCGCPGGKVGPFFPRSWQRRLDPNAAEAQLSPAAGAPNSPLDRTWVFRGKQCRAFWNLQQKEQRGIGARSAS